LEAQRLLVARGCFLLLVLLALEAEANLSEAAELVQKRVQEPVRILELETTLEQGSVVQLARAHGRLGGERHS